ncbi:MAG: acyl-CoA dehydrogenase family protein [Deltaproteobacteria bacterium]|nr:acyl-CoA dehydrogenase family protein [Deltaproteobacteria bacterium]
MMDILLELTDEQREIQKSVRDFVVRAVDPIANELDADYKEIPESVLKGMAELGYFGATIPDTYGGLGLDYTSMCLLTEELARGWFAVGSVGTRGYIAGAALLRYGTEEQKRRWLPAIASGEMLVGICLTEPNFGSDLAGITCRAERTATGYRISGEKSWVTLGNRASLLMVLVRTSPDAGLRHKGLSVLFVEKRPGNDLAPPHLTGKPIPCVGYHGLKTYTYFFEGLEVPRENLLGGEEGIGFKQTMTALETGRCQTAARGLGVAQAALDDAIAYAKERVCFGKPLSALPVIQHKIAHMSTDVASARQLVYAVARQMDKGGRCDVEAAHAKSHASEVAFRVADENVQIHGAYGYSMEYNAQRYWRDARLLKIFEGTHEILQNVIARGVLDLA